MTTWQDTDKCSSIVMALRSQQTQKRGAGIRCNSDSDIHQNSNQQKLLIPWCEFQHELFFMSIICVKGNANVDVRDKYIYT